MRVLIAGDIVGSSGRTIFARTAFRMKNQGEVDLVIANAENSAGGRGITPALAEELFAGGADALTMGDHTWDQKELADYLPREKRIVRPANFPEGCPGKGWVTLDTPFGPVTVINLIGRVFMAPNECPFRAADAIIDEVKHTSRVILVDIHAEATSEKIAMGRYLDGRVSVVFGTHTHVPTADETILPKGTAYITDLGMTGPDLSVLGRDHESVLRRFLTGMPTKFRVATDNDAKLEGIVVDIDERNGKPRRIERIREPAGSS